MPHKRLDDLAPDDWRGVGMHLEHRLRLAEDITGELVLRGELRLRKFEERVFRVEGDGSEVPFPVAGIPAPLCPLSILAGMLLDGLCSEDSA